MAGLKSVRVFPISVQLHRDYCTAFKTANVGSFADPGNKNALDGSSTITKYMPFSR